MEIKKRDKDRKRKKAKKKNEIKNNGVTEW